MLTPRLYPKKALTLASAAVDLRIAQVVDLPMVGVEAILPLDIFKNELGAKMKAAAKAGAPAKVMVTAMGHNDQLRSLMGGALQAAPS